MLRVTLALLVLHALSDSSLAAIPVIYSTDLYHPHGDPDDHYDLATLFALPELDVRGIIFDMSNIREKRGRDTTPKRPALVALRQMRPLTGKQPSFTTGLEYPLRSIDDPATDQPESTQGGVKMILSTLRESEQKVCIFTVGSLIDVAAAYNRQPTLFHEKVSAIYINAGTGPDGFQEEWNVHLDKNAYQRILLSDLQVLWYPCFGRDGYSTHFVVDQTEVLGSAPAPLRAFFAYALDKSTAEPVAFLTGDYPPPQGARNMWCTASFVDLAGRKIYRTKNGYEALAQPPSESGDPTTDPITCYRMQQVKLTLGEPAAGPTDSGATATYLGRTRDRIGKSELKGDDVPDCEVHIAGLNTNRTIRKAVLTGPGNGIWLDRPNPDRWLLNIDRDGDTFLLAFSFFRYGRHRLDLVFDDGSSQDMSFHVPQPGSPYFASKLDTTASNLRVMHKQEPEYTEVMTSVLKNLLLSTVPTSPK